MKTSTSNNITATKTLHYKFTDKHIKYMQRAKTHIYNIAEGAVRAGKTVDNVLAFALLLETSKDRYHLASGTKTGNAKLNIGACNGFGLENIFRGRSRWGKYLDNECMYIQTATGEKIVMFVGGANSDSFKAIRGNSYGYWIATEIDQHHPSFIEEALTRQLMADEMKLFWDLNPNNPNHWIYKDYIDAWADKEMAGGYNYEHFTIYDNASLTDDRKDQIASRWVKGSLQHGRSILGLRMVADGLVYQYFAENADEFIISYEKAKNINYSYLSIGVDIGGTTSKHAFVLSGITRDMKLVAIKSKVLDTNIDPNQLALEYTRFAKKCLREFRVTSTYIDNAEQVIKKGFETKSFEQRLKIPIRDSVKGTVKARIEATETLIAQGRFFYTDQATTVKDALREAMWDKKQAEKGIEVRLDDGSTDIDTLDAFEYSWSKHINRLVKAGG